METKHHLNEVTNINYQINDTAELEVVEYYIILLLNNHCNQPLEESVIGKS